MLPKETEAACPLEALRLVAGGEGLIAPAVALRLIAEFSVPRTGGGDTGEEVPEPLAVRERARGSTAARGR